MDEKIKLAIDSVLLNDGWREGKRDRFIKRIEIELERPGESEVFKEIKERALKEYGINHMIPYEELQIVTSDMVLVPEYCDQMAYDIQNSMGEGSTCSTIAKAFLDNIKSGKYKK